ncbi:MAG: glycosyltransferase, partial [Pseudomonadota bacterium]
MRPERARENLQRGPIELPFKRVALVANTGWNIVRFRIDLIRTLADYGCRVSVIADFDVKQEAQLRRLGVEPITIKMDAAGHNPIRDLAYLGRLTQALRRTRPELVHLYTTKPFIYGGLAARLLGVPGIVGSFTGAGILRSERKTWLKPILRQLIRLALTERSLTIFQNPEDLAAFVADGLTEPSRATCVAGSGVDTTLLTPNFETPPAQRTCFVMASRMLWSKGVADFVSAARLVKEHHPDVSFVLFGGSREEYGSKNPDFIERDWLENLNRGNVVEWRAWTEPAEVEAAMRTAAAVVLP